MGNTTLLFDIASIEHFKEDYVADRLDQKILEYADLLLAGQLTIGHDSLEHVRYDPDLLGKFDWVRQDGSVNNTTLLYIFGLRHVYILSRAFYKTKKTRYMDLAWDFITSLHSHLISNEAKNSFFFNVHAVAERLENLVYFGHIANLLNYKINNFLLIRDVIENCTTRLADDINYPFKHNQGIIADKGLIIGSYCLNKANSGDMIDHAILRLKDQIKFAYDLDGVHVENSIEYHMAMTNFLQSIQNCLLYIHHNYAEELTTILEHAIDFMVYALKPDLQRPLFGDSKGGSVIEPFKNPKLDYITSRGKNGLMPSKLVAYFYHSGYVFLREHFNPENFEQSTWLSLKAGFVTRTHKHQDDLSICLFSKGIDIFVDAGMYNFMPKDIYKDYMESIPAHTTIGIVDRPYSIARANGEKFTIQQVKHTDSYEYVLASSRVYDSCTIYRHLYYFRAENTIIIRDNVFSTHKQLFAQYFHLGPKMLIKEIDAKRSVLEIGNSGYSIVMKQLNDVDGLNLLKGTETEPMSILSTGFSEFEDTQTIQFFKENNHCEFITSVEIKPNNAASDERLDLVKLENGDLVINSKIVKLEANVPLVFPGAEISCENLTIKIKNKIQNDINHEFALYIYNHNTHGIITKTPYTLDQNIEFSFLEPGDYDLFYFVSNGRREVIKGILATIRQKDGILHIQRVYDALHSPNVGFLVVNKKNKFDYSFEIPITYDFHYQVKWWVYRNGINQTMVSDQLTNSFSYRFSKPGDYVIICSVSDPYFGEFYFTQSELIHHEYNAMQLWWYHGQSFVRQLWRNLFPVK